MPYKTGLSQRLCVMICCVNAGDLSALSGGSRPQCCSKMSYSMVTRWCASRAFMPYISEITMRMPGTFISSAALLSLLYLSNMFQIGPLPRFLHSPPSHHTHVSVHARRYVHLAQYRKRLQLRLNLKSVPKAYCHLHKHLMAIAHIRFICITYSRRRRRRVITFVKPTRLTES